MSKFTVVQYPGDDRWHLELFIEQNSSTLRFTFMGQTGWGEAEEMAKDLNKQIESASSQLSSVGIGPKSERWRQDIG